MRLVWFLIGLILGGMIGKYILCFCLIYTPRDKFEKFVKTLIKLRQNRE